MVILRSSALQARSAGDIPVGSLDPNDTTVEIADLSDRDIAEANFDPAIVGVAGSMPVHLIQPVSSGDEPPVGGTDGSWGIKAVKADMSRFDGAGITVAVLDTGIDCEHPAFKERGIAIDRRNFTTETDDGDTNGHGTHCAGTIFGRDVDGRRIGVAPGVDKALIAKVIGEGGGSTGAICKAILWAAQGGAHVISMSLGMDFELYRSRLAEKMPGPAATSMALAAYRDNLRLFDNLSRITNTYGATVPGVVVVAATGNESARPDYRIAAVPPSVAEAFVAVGALGRGEGPSAFVVARFSNSEPRLVAPGVDILSAGRDGGLAVKSGTSMATPHVAGVAALWAHRMRERGQQFQATQVVKAMERAALPLTTLFDELDVGVGLVQAP